MKILIAPMAAVAETSGPFSRARKLAVECLKRGHEGAFCAAEEVNYKPSAGVPNYYAPVPSPLGLPMCLGKRMFRNAQQLGIQQRKTVHSYEEVLHLVGATSKRHFPKDVEALRKAIRQFQPDVVYAEFRIAAIVAAKLEQKPVVTGFSYPVQCSYASSPQFARHVRKYLKSHNLPEVKSSLEIFDWADLKIVPSSHDLEPIDSENVIFTGPFVPETDKIISPAQTSPDFPIIKNTIVVYMGNGSITAKRLLSVLSEAFSDTPYAVYIASQQLEEQVLGNITVAKRFNFGKLLPQAVAFVNHGGQNSIMDGLLNGVPQLICPGKVFERQYNASSVFRLKAGIILSDRHFKAATIKQAVETLRTDLTFADNARKAGQQLRGLGGVTKAVEEVERIAAKNEYIHSNS